MGRRINMTKIDDITKCQVTFSKRRSSLIKKANEIAVCCDADIAFVAFSPSGRISKFCNQTRIEDVLHRYVNLPVECRLSYIGDVQNLELQIKKGRLQLQLLETDLRDYELYPDKEPSLHQLSWCERNVNNSLQRILARKSELLDNASMSSGVQRNNTMDELGLDNLNGIELPLSSQNPTNGQILMHLDPWISPYSAKVRESIFQNIMDLANIFSTNNQGETSNISCIPMSLNMPNISLQYYSSPVVLDSGTLEIPYAQQPQAVDQTLLLSMVEQNRVNNDWNQFSWMSCPNAIDHNSIQHQGLANLQSPSPNAVNIYEASTTRLQYANMNTDTIACDVGQTVPAENGKQKISDNVDEEAAGGSRVIDNTMNGSNQYEVVQDTMGVGSNASWTSGIEKSNLWEWDDLLHNENFNFTDYLK